MRKRTRGVSLLLAAAVVAGLLTVPASAAGKPYIRQVVSGRPAVMAVTSSGDVYAWGSNDLGLIDRENRDGNWGWNAVLTPTKILSGVKKVAAPHEAGYFNMGNMLDIPSSQMGKFILYIKENGELWGAGDNSIYQLGQGEAYGYLNDDDFFSWDTTPVKILDDVKDVACNGNAGCAIKENGDLYFWGVNVAQSTTGGTENFYTTYTTPTKILSGVKAVDMGADHILALKEDGTLWGMGCQDAGTLGNGKDLSGTKDALQNSMVQIMSGCIDMAAGDHASFAVKSNGDLYAWGENIQSRLGISYNQAREVLTPTKVDSGVRQVVSAEWNAYYVKNDNTVWSTGTGEWGRRGFYDRDTYYGIDPLIGRVPISGEIADITTNGRTTILLKKDGTMWGFGDTSGLGTGVEWYPNPAKPYDSASEWQDVPYIWNPIPCGLSAGSFAGMFGPVQEEVELVAGFSDVAANGYYRDAVEWAVDRGITSGTGGTTFSPERDCTRGEIITFLWRASGSPQTSTIAIIEDIAPGQFYFDAVTWAAEQGIIEDGVNFRPNDPCTRAMAVEFLWRAAGAQAISMDTGFTDVPASASYSTAVEWAVIEGITSGTSATTFSPDTVCTRAQIVTFLYRAFA